LAREDLLVAEAKPMFEKDEEKKQELFKSLEQSYATILGAFEKMVNENPKKSGFVAGSKMSLGDIIIFEGTQSLAEHNPAGLDKYPSVKAVRDKVTSHPEIKKYLANRKKTEF